MENDICSLAVSPRQKDFSKAKISPNEENTEYFEGNKEVEIILFGTTNNIARVLTYLLEQFETENETGL